MNNGDSSLIAADADFSLNCKIVLDSRDVTGTYVEFFSEGFDVRNDSLPDIPSARTDVDHDDDIKIAFWRWFLFAVARTSLLK